MYADRVFTKENLDFCLKELAKDFRKRNRAGIPVEIILIGGASVLLNYGFREMTYDIDAMISVSGSLKESVQAVGEKFGLPADWLNTDFMKTGSYSASLVEHSKYYKTFSNILQVRTVTAEYLVAMKLMAGRLYKHDLSDIAGILAEHEEQGEVLSFDMVKRAVEELYGSYDRLPENSRNFIEAVYRKESLKDFYRQCTEYEAQNKEILLGFQEEYPGVLNAGNIEDVLAAARKKLQ